MVKALVQRFKVLPKPNLKRVYVWEVPVRLFHWVNVIVIIALCITGFLIGNPPAIQSANEASFAYWFGINRFIHFIAAYLFTFNLIVRLYWAFAGNKYARWNQFMPTSKKYFQELWHVLKVDILLMKGKPHIAVGHNPLAALSYLFIIFAMIIMIITGFGLYADMSDWWFAMMFQFVASIFGEEFIIRQIHHITMWVFIVFTIIHVHLVIFHDFVEGRGEMSSMISGYKFIEKQILDQKRDAKHAE